MPAVFPTPNYIALDNVEELIGEKVLFSDSDPNGISTTNANMLIAAGEALALEDLSPFYITVPALITTQGGDWSTLPSYTYSIIYNMFVYRAALEIIGSFIAKNTDAEHTLSYFQKYYYTQYANLLSRVNELLPNGAYKFPLIGLQVTNTGIPRVPRRYAISGQLGAGNYTSRQLISPSKNFDIQWGSTSAWEGW